MYIPKFYKVTDPEEIRAFLQQHSFGTLVTTRKGRPIATHLPLQLMQEGDEYFLTGHMAYGNPQWRTFEADKEVLIMFQGPHAYVSSSWYEQENVPTWNYQAVHLYGEPRVLDETEPKEDLAKLLRTYEKHRDHPVLWETLSPSLIEKELKGIVGFKIRVMEIQAAYKMSQNRSETDYRNIVEQLQQEEAPDAARMAEEMRRRR